jgi:hypothetical protein
MLFPYLFPRKLPVVYIVSSDSYCHHDRKDAHLLNNGKCLRCQDVPTSTRMSSACERRQTAEEDAKEIVRMFVNKDESLTVEHINHRKDKDGIPSNESCMLNDTWIVRRGLGWDEVRVTAVALWPKQCSPWGKSLKPPVK